MRCSDRFKQFVNSKSTEGFHFSVLRQNDTFLCVCRCVHRVLLVGYAPAKVAPYIHGINYFFKESSLAKFWVMQLISRSIQNFLVVRKLQYNITLLPSVNTLIARGMFCGAKYTHHTFTPIIKHLIPRANKHPGKKSLIDNNMRKSHWHQAVHIT